MRSIESQHEDNETQDKRMSCCEHSSGNLAQGCPATVKQVRGNAATYSVFGAWAFGVLTQMWAANSLSS
jgi:hypothetical protein